MNELNEVTKSKKEVLKKIRKLAQAGNEKEVNQMLADNPSLSLKEIGKKILESYLLGKHTAMANQFLIKIIQDESFGSDETSDTSFLRKIYKLFAKYLLSPLLQSDDERITALHQFDIMFREDIEAALEEISKDNETTDEELESKPEVVFHLPGKLLTPGVTLPQSTSNKREYTPIVESDAAKLLIDDTLSAKSKRSISSRLSQLYLADTFFNAGNNTHNERKVEANNNTLSNEKHEILNKPNKVPPFKCNL